MKICLNGYGSLIIDRRRENFNHLMSIFHLNSDLSISLTFKNLNEKDTPYFFPIRINLNAYTIIDELRNDGIPVISWPALDKNHENFSSAESIRSDFIFFPLHEGILEHHLEYMVKAFKDKVALC